MRPWRIGRIARWEITRSVGTLDRKTVFALCVIAIVAGIAGVVAIDQGTGLEDEIYRVGVAADSPYGDVVEDSAQFVSEETTLLEFLHGETDADVFAGDPGQLLSDGTQKGDAAHDAFRDAVERHNEELMQLEPDREAAYPVTVSLEYLPRNIPADSTGETASSGDSPAESSTDSEERDRVDGSIDDGDTQFGDGDTLSSDETSLQVPNLGGGTGDEIHAQTPGAISPPFPFQSLILAFLFIVPMNFLIQTYGSTIMDERIKRRGELLLVTPASRYEIVSGKTLPYLIGLFGIVVAIAAFIGGGVTSVAAAMPIALLFLAATFVGAMLARSFKELTFVTVTISVVLTTYTFVPAIFTDVTPIALISPLTLVVMDLQGEAITFGQYLFSTAPFYVASIVLFLLGTGMYREEDMFSQKPIPSKVVDAIASHVHGYRSVPLLSILSIPFVFAAELLAIALLFAFPLHVSIPVLLLVIAGIEEFAKSIHVYAGFARSRFESSVRMGAILGGLSGIGFFLGEKVTHVTQFVGLSDLELGQAAFGPTLSLDSPILLVVFFAPMILHATTAIISAIGASQGRSRYALALVLATLVHATYNAGVIILVG